MKYCFIVVAAICFQATTVAQTGGDNDPIIEVHLKGAQLYKALVELQEKSKIQIGYIYEWLKYAKPVTIDTIAPFSQVLKICLKDQPLDCGWKSDANPPLIGLFPKALQVIVTDSTGNPLMGVTVKGDNLSKTTDYWGRCIFPKGACDSLLTLTSIDREIVKVKLEGQTVVLVKMAVKVSNMDTIVSDGYHFIPKERQTGSFFLLSKTFLDQSTSPSIFERMVGRGLGVLFNNVNNSYTNEPSVQIRGQATIYANSNALIVVDGFPFRGDIRSINPNDVVSVSILRDAAAASVWGAMAGNGVIVITTKKAKFSQRFKVHFNTNITVIPKRNLFYMPQLTPDEFSVIEEQRLDSGYYGNALMSNNTALSSVIEIWSDYRNKKISANERDAKLAILKVHDVRNDLEKYFYRNGILQQNYINLSGGTEKLSYNFSGGFNRENANEVNTVRNHVTLNGGFGYKFKDFEALMYNSISFFKDVNNGRLPGGFYPNSFIVDPSGNAAIAPADIRQGFKDSINKLDILQNWDRRPLDELKENKFQYKQNSQVFNISIKYTLIKKFTFTLLYQHYFKKDEITDYNSPKSYKARHLQNSFAQYQAGIITYPIPKGGILSWQNNTLRGENGRFQVNWDLGEPKQLRFSGLMGFEFNKIHFDSTAGVYYGYYPDQPQIVKMNFNEKYKMFYDESHNAFIPYQSSIGSNFNYSSSMFANIGITYKGRYNFTSSVRTDESNLFGAKEKAKRIPLGSVGVKWDVNEEPALKLPWLSYLNARASMGTSGNINNTVSAYATAERAPTNNIGQAPLTILTPNNDHIRWERSYMTNVALEWSDINQIFQFAIEYYWRDSRYLLAPSLQDPTYGYTNYWDNTARMKGKGFDFSLQTNVASNNFKFFSLFWLCHATNKVTRFENPRSQARFFTDNRFLSPREGSPVYAVNAFRWAGLDPTTGNPQVQWAGNPSTEYIKINGSSPDSSLVNVGSSKPTLYGAWSPIIRYKSFSANVTILGKFKYFFKRSSINYSDPYTSTIAGEDDFPKRWRKAGDEKYTDVPSQKIAPDYDRDNTYANSTILIEKGDNIKLKSLKFDLDLSNAVAGKWGIKRISVYAFIDNVVTIWKATKTRVDPDYLTGPPASRTYTLGVDIEL